MDELLSKLLSAVLIAVIPVLAGFVCDLFRKAANEISLRAKTEREKALIEEIDHAVETAVRYVNQTFVEEMKKSQLWKDNEEYSTEAFNEALKKTIETISDDASRYILDTFGDMRNYLEVKIESMVQSEKGWL